VGQRLSFNRKGSRSAEARHDGSSRLRVILDSVQMCCLVKIAHYATEPRQESVGRQVPLWELEAPVALAADLFNRAGMGWVEEPYRRSDALRIRAATLWVHTFLSHGWWSPIRPSSSHLTITSSSFAGSTVLYSPVGFPKLPRPSTRSPGCSSLSVAESSASGGFRARPESADAPGYDKGSWRACAVWGAVYWPQVPDRQATDHPG
jgi:hypothetical protein